MNATKWNEMFHLSSIGKYDDKKDCRFSHKITNFIEKIIYKIIIEIYFKRFLSKNQT